MIFFPVTVKSIFVGHKLQIFPISVEMGNICGDGSNKMILHGRIEPFSPTYVYAYQIKQNSQTVERTSRQVHVYMDDCIVFLSQLYG